MWIHLVWMAPALGVVYLYGFHRRRRGLEAFARAELLPHLTAAVDRGRQYWRAALVIAGAALVAAAIARPQWGQEVEEIHRRGIDLVVLLDLSRSMLAEDVQPNRLARAKADLLEMTGLLRGDRIGLVAFAGRAEVRCPLTFDHGFFRHVLEELRVGAVTLGGTSIGDAIHKGIDCFADDFPNHKALLLITDGEDHERFVKDAIARARERSIPIFAVGIGDQQEGRRIPVTDAQGNRVYLQDASGREVWSKMNPALLQEAALETGGAYASAGAGSDNRILDLYRGHIDAIEKKELEGYKEERYKDRYQWILAAGCILLAMEPLIATRRTAAGKTAAVASAPATGS